MKTKDIAAKYGLDKAEFENFCLETPEIETSGFASISIADHMVDRAVKLFKMSPEERTQSLQKEKERTESVIKEERENAEKRAAEAKSAAEPIRHRAKENLKNGLMFWAEGKTGRSIKVYPFKVIINTDPTFASFMAGNYYDGEKTIYFRDIIGVQYRRAGAGWGYLQLETASCLMNNKSNNFFNENTFVFNYNSEDIEEMYEYIIGRLDELKQF